MLSGWQAAHRLIWLRAQACGFVSSRGISGTALVELRDAARAVLLLSLGHDEHSSGAAGKYCSAASTRLALRPSAPPFAASSCASAWAVGLARAWPRTLVIADGHASALERCWRAAASKMAAALSLQPWQLLIGQWLLSIELRRHAGRHGGSLQRPPERSTAWSQPRCPSWGQCGCL